MKPRLASTKSLALILILGLLGPVPAAWAVDIGTAITYQGSLSYNGATAQGPYDFRFLLFDAASGGAQVGSISMEDVSVISGVFNVELDFGNAFDTNAARWLQVEARLGTSTGAYTILPRQRLNPAPVAHKLRLPAYHQKSDAGYLLSLVNGGTGHGANFNALSALPNPGVSYGVQGTTNSTGFNSAGVRGVASGATGNLIGVEGVATASTSGGTGLVGRGGATGAYVEGIGAGTKGLVAVGGLYGVTANASDAASTALFGQGVLRGAYGEGTGPNGIGVWAKGTLVGTYSEVAGTGENLVLSRGAPAGNFIRASVLGDPQDRFWVDNEGTTHTRVLEILGGSDLSERFDVVGDDAIEPGTVVSIDGEHEGRLEVSREPYDHRVAGIVSGAGGVRTGMLMAQQGSHADGEHPVALTGRVYCRATSRNGPIRPGDLLTTSSVPGHAMRADDPARAQGAILGKAMGSLDRGEGLVLVLVGLQ